jgi:hypothetical protein
MDEDKELLLALIAGAEALERDQPAYAHRLRDLAIYIFSNVSPKPLGRQQLTLEAEIKRAIRGQEILQWVEAQRADPLVDNPSILGKAAAKFGLSERSVHRHLAEARSAKEMEGRDLDGPRLTTVKINPFPAKK